MVFSPLLDTAGGAAGGEAGGGGAIERLGTAASRAGSEAYRLDGIDGMMETTGYGGTMDAPDMRHEGRGELQKKSLEIVLGIF